MNDCMKYRLIETNENAEMNDYFPLRLSICFFTRSHLLCLLQSRLTRFILLF